MEKVHTSIELDTSIWIECFPRHDTIYRNHPTYSLIWHILPSSLDFGLSPTPFHPSAYRRYYSTSTWIGTLKSVLSSGALSPPGMIEGGDWRWQKSSCQLEPQNKSSFGQTRRAVLVAKTYKLHYRYLIILVILWDWFSKSKGGSAHTLLKGISSWLTHPISI
jgi:hypothetical protein